MAQTNGVKSHPTATLFHIPIIADLIDSDWDSSRTAIELTVLFFLFTQFTRKYNPMIQKKQLMEPSNFGRLLSEVQNQLEQLQPDHAAQQAALHKEKTELEQSRQGWLRTLSNSELSPILRNEVEQEFEAAILRIQQIVIELNETDSASRQKRAAIDPESVADRLLNLDRILDSDHASAMNVELSKHIKSIECSPDGKVVVNTCLMGALAELNEANDLFQLPDDVASTLEKTGIKPRRRTRRNLSDVFDDDSAAIAKNDFAVDPERFDKLSPQLFQIHEFQVPEKKSWPEENAQAVAEFRLNEKLSMEKTAKHFGKSIPTIRNALKYAKSSHGMDAFGRELSRPNHQNWVKENALRVDAYFQKPGVTMPEAVKHFGKSQPTLSKAKKFARQIRNEAVTSNASSQSLDPSRTGNDPETTSSKI